MSGPSSTLPLPVASNSEEEAATLGGGVSTSSTAAIIPDKSAEPTQSRPGASSEEERKPNAPAPSSLENDTSNNPDSTKETDVPPSLEESPISIPVTILLQSGARHQFSIDRKYLERHNVKGEMMKENLVNPFDMTVWQLKECVWKDWKEEWDQRPASALFIKLIQFGAYMNDSSALRDCRVTKEGPNVIHMAIRPAETGEDDVTQRSTKGAFGGREREGSGRTPSCRCVIM